MTIFKAGRLFAVALITVGIGVSTTAAAEPVPGRSVVVHGTGAVPHGATKSPPSIAARATALPASVDLTRWAMPVGDQGLTGSCVPWAVNYNQMGWYANKAGTPFAGAPMYVYSQIHLDNSFDGGGSYPAAAYRIGVQQGVDSRAHYVPQGDYDFTDKPTAAQRANAAHHKIITPADFILYNVQGPGVRAVAAIKEQLAAGNPVALEFPVYSAFDDLDAHDWTLNGSDVDPGTLRGYHEVLILGYDATGVRIENQWGTGWGQAGFANMDWPFIEQYSIEATIMTGLKPDPTQQVPSAPATAAVSVKGTTATLSWTPPTHAGSSPVIGYRLSRDGTHPWSGDVAATVHSYSFGGLAAGKYHLTVSAINAVGVGPATSATAAVSRPANVTGSVRITRVHYSSPEFVVVKNYRHTTLRLKNWTLVARLPHHRIVLPGHHVAPGDRVRIYTGGHGKTDSPHRIYLHRKHGLWPAHGDTATLLNKYGHVVSRYTY